MIIAYTLHYDKSYTSNMIVNGTLHYHLHPLITYPVNRSLLICNFACWLLSQVDKNAHLSDSEDPLMQLFSVHLAPRFLADELLNCEVGNRFLLEIAQLFTLLRALGRYPVSQDFEDERTSATLTLIE